MYPRKMVYNYRDIYIIRFGVMCPAKGFDYRSTSEIFEVLDFRLFHFSLRRLMNVNITDDR